MWTRSTDRRRANSGGRARCPPDHPRQGQGVHRPRPRPRPDGKALSPNTVHWTTWALANGTSNAVVKTGGDTGSSSPPTTVSRRPRAGHRGGRDQERRQGPGRVRHPLSTQDFSSFLLQAQASAKVVGLASAAAHVNAIKRGPSSAS
jgi:hypothetical protein